MLVRTPLQERERHWYAAKHREVVELVGKSQKARLRWLVESFGVHANQSTPVTFRVAEISAFLLIQGGAGTRLSAMPGFRKSDLNYLAQTVKEGVELLLDAKQWKVEIRQSVDRILVRRTGVKGVDNDEPFGVRSTWQPRSKSGLLAAFLLTACDLIERQQSLLSRCPREDCARVFVKDDRRQRYCSTRCSQTRRTRRFRARIGR
jgi:hypothetical protein